MVVGLGVQCRNGMWGIRLGDAGWWVVRFGLPGRAQGVGIGGVGVLACGSAWQGGAVWVGGRWWELWGRLLGHRDGGWDGLPVAGGCRCRRGLRAPGRRATPLGGAPLRRGRRSGGWGGCPPGGIPWPARGGYEGGGGGGVAGAAAPLRPCRAGRGALHWRDWGGQWCHSRLGTLWRSPRWTGRGVAAFPSCMAGE